MNQAWRRYILGFLTMPVTVYVLCILMIWPFLNYAKLRDNALTQTMSRFVPPIRYAEDFEKASVYDPLKLRLCISYHQRVALYFPYQKAEALSMMGYCYSLMGNIDQSIKAYTSSVEANPHYFWSYYNLGLMLYKKGRYADAFGYLQEALQKDPKVQLLLLSRSKVFLDVRRSSAEYEQHDFAQAIVQGRRDAYMLMTDCLAKLKDYKKLMEISIIGIKESLGKEDFFYYYAGRAAYELKAYEHAVRFFEMVLKVNPQHADAWVYLSYCMRDAGRVDMAEDFLAKSRQVGMKESDSLRYLDLRLRIF